MVHDANRVQDAWCSFRLAEMITVARECATPCEPLSLTNCACLTIYCTDVIAAVATSIFFFDPIIALLSMLNDAALYGEGRHCYRGEL